MFLHKLWYHKGSAQLHLCTALQFTQEQVVNITRQSTTKSLWKTPSKLLEWRLHTLGNVLLSELDQDLGCIVSNDIVYFKEITNGI